MILAKNKIITIVVIIGLITVVLILGLIPLYMLYGRQTTTTITRKPTFETIKPTNPTISKLFSNVMTDKMITNENIKTTTTTTTTSNNEATTIVDSNLETNEATDATSEDIDITVVITTLGDVTKPNVDQTSATTLSDAMTIMESINTATQVHSNIITTVATTNSNSETNATTTNITESVYSTTAKIDEFLTTNMTEGNITRESVNWSESTTISSTEPSSDFSMDSSHRPVTEWTQSTIETTNDASSILNTSVRITIGMYTSL